VHEVKQWFFLKLRLVDIGHVLWFEWVPQKWMCWKHNLQIYKFTDFGGEVFGRWLGLDEVMRVGTPW
jgi:hypothetical protein